jgi:hypothetical protein
MASIVTMQPFSSGASSSSGIAVIPFGFSAVLACPSVSPSPCANAETRWIA